MALVLGVTSAITSAFAQTGTAVVFGESVPSLTWDASLDSTVIGYYVKSGPVGGMTTNIFDAGTNTLAKIAGLTPGKTNFIFVTAYTAKRVESDPSNWVYYYPLSAGESATNSGGDNSALSTGGPSVTLGSPQNDSAFTNISELAVTVVAVANTAGATIARIEFFDDATKLGETTGDGAFSWNPVAPGPHVLWAKATDTLGGTGQSSSRVITVYSFASGDLTPPSVVLATAAGASDFLVGLPVALSANASAGNGTISRVEFYANNALIAAVAGPSPCAATWIPSTEGVCVLRARAYTAANYTNDSSPVSVTAYSGFIRHAPKVSLVNPTNGASLDYGLPVTLEASATTTDPSIGVSRVEFNVDGNYLGSASSAPYVMAWPHPAKGKHAVWAKAYDRFGTSALSATNAVAIQSAEVVLNLHFDGDTRDSSSNNLPTVAYGGLNFVRGVRNQAGQFASNSYVAINDVAPLAFTDLDFTVEAWINANSLPTDGRACVWSHDNRDAGGLWLVLSGNAVALGWADAASAALPMASNEWHHIAAVRQGDTLSLYADGSRLTTAPCAGSLPTSANPAQVGAYGGSNGFSGLIDELKITLGQAAYAGATYPFNPPPTVTLASPTDGKAVTPDTIHLAANAAAAASVARLEILTNNVTMLTTNTAGLLYDWVNPATGTYAIQAVVLDALGASASSAVVSLTVESVAVPPLNDPPVGADAIRPAATFTGPSDLRVEGQPVTTNVVSGSSSPVLVWQASPEPSLAGYYLNFGPVGGATNRSSMGKLTTTRLSDLGTGTNYFFFVTAYQDSGVVSEPSNVLVYHPLSVPQKTTLTIPGQ